MSRIGKKPVPIGSAKVTLQDRLVRVEGPKGKLEQRIHPTIKVALDAAKKELVVTRPDDERQSKALHGLTRSLLANMVEGVTNGYKKSLEVQGVGYKAELKGKTLVMAVGYANTINVTVPAGVTVTVEGREDSRDAGRTSSWWGNSPATFGGCASPSRTRARACDMKAKW